MGAGRLAGATAFAADAPRRALTAAKATHARLLGIAIVDGHLAAVGQQGVILRSADGKNWQQVPSPVSSMLTRVRFLDARHGWIVGYDGRSEEHTSELQSLMRISYAVFCLKKKTQITSRQTLRIT